MIDNDIFIQEIINKIQISKELIFLKSMKLGLPDLLNNNENSFHIELILELKLIKNIVSANKIKSSEERLFERTEKVSEFINTNFLGYNINDGIDELKSNIDKLGILIQGNAKDHLIDEKIIDIVFIVENRIALGHYNLKLMDVQKLKELVEKLKSYHAVAFNEVNQEQIDKFNKFLNEYIDFLYSDCEELLLMLDKKLWHEKITFNPYKEIISEDSINPFYMFMVYHIYV